MVPALPVCVQHRPLPPHALVEGGRSRLSIRAGWLAQQDRGGISPGVAYFAAPYVALRVPFNGDQRGMALPHVFVLHPVGFPDRF